eukprot:gb/GEZN01011572.1/.p1 GENE.gb/GEZN01011572.1/~~gb/GEZN01011572.1/.p1  ORF type:complete len:310 (+),score=30.40 gb/GEZN01011572.1/:69-998(+)
MRRLRFSTVLGSQGITPQTSAPSRGLQIAKTIQEFQEMRGNFKGSVGFVPTMGALHDGHLSLLEQAQEENTTTVASIFVNPTQFLPEEDLQKYPRTYESDLARLKAHKLDYLFAPTTLYNPSHATFVDIDGIDKLSMEGSARPGHFRGVCTVVTKLFNIVKPDLAYFGQKDGMQCIALSQMVRDLNFPVTLRICPTIREADGLAMSSRNAYLTPKERKAAPIVYKALQAAETAFHGGERSCRKLEQIVSSVVNTESLAYLLYVNVADSQNGQMLTQPHIPHSTQVMLSIAVRVGSTRLIDNLLLGTAQH